MLAACDGGAPPGAVAARFQVARASSAYLGLKQRRGEGRVGPKRLGGGPRPATREGAEAALLRLLGADNDLTLAGDADRLAAAEGGGGARVHPWTIGRALRWLGWARKEEDPARHRAGARGHRGRPAGLAG